MKVEFGAMLSPCPPSPTWTGKIAPIGCAKPLKLGFERWSSCAGSTMAKLLPVDAVAVPDRDMHLV